MTPASPTALLRRLVLLVGLLALPFIVVGYVTAQAAIGASAAAVPASTDAGSTDPLCRFGVNVVSSFGQHNLDDFATLRMGWYLDYQAFPNAPNPNGAEYALVMTLEQTGPNRTDYNYYPNGAQLQQAIATNPGAVWFIGNEPDRRDFQNDIEPHVYAAVYHELYGVIKGADPEAHIFAGTIVQPTPVRLLYLDMILDSYRAHYGTLMPVDGWSIHNFILNEVSCDYDPGNCWGAEIPPGINWPFGEVVTVEDNDNVDLFIERIVRFRQWMADRGYRGAPVYLSEYGVLMPDWLGFDPPRVNAFMDATFDYLTTATHPTLGDPNDEYRLIQKWSWYSTVDTAFNGNLFDPGTFNLNEMGLNYAGYTAGLAADTDLLPTRLGSEPHAPFSSGGNVTFTLRATLANSGNVVPPAGPVTVRFYDGNPQAGGQQIGADQVVTLAGCGDFTTAAVTWADVPPGGHIVYVTVDPQNAIAESDETNNSMSQLLVVATERLLLPSLFR